MSGVNPNRHEAGDEPTMKDLATFVKRQHEMVARTLSTLERRVKGSRVLDVVFQFSNWKKEKDSGSLSRGRKGRNRTLRAGGSILYQRIFREIERSVQLHPGTRTFATS